MRFGPVPLSEATGTILAHTARLDGLVLRKGAVLDAAGVEALRAAGREQVIAATLEPGDVTEDACADRLARALMAEGLGRGRATTGRVNLRAAAAGLLVIDAGAVDRLNAVDEALTIGTLPSHSVVAPRDMVATIKVIPFAVPGRVLAAAEAIATAAPVFTLHPFRPLRVGLVMSVLPGLSQALLDGAERATRDRIEALGGSLMPPVICDHTTATIGRALSGLLAEGADLLLIVGASAVVDRRDVGPEGIVSAGGAIVHFGMPVDPGNLICVGRIGAVPALVLPGCARSPRSNGIDLVLSRLFAGLPVGAREVMGMGVGGLLIDTPIRPMPREAEDAEHADEDVLNVAAVVLAAGRSSRMGGRNKLLIEGADGRAMVARVVDTVLAGGARPVIVVTGHAADGVCAALAGRDVTFVHAPDFAAGLSASLRAGIEAVPHSCVAALVCLGDMPLVSAGLIGKLIAAYNSEAGTTVVVPTWRGELGNPVLWDRRHFASLRSLTGDRGARGLLERLSPVRARVEADDDGILRDFDTPESLAGLSTE